MPNATQADVDRDGLGDACDDLPPGNVPPIAGMNTIARTISGEVFVKLPATVQATDFRRPYVPLQESGFVPLKGIASLPVGSTVDSRKGRVAVTSAANNRPVGDSRRRLGAATFAAGIFRLRQARAQRVSSRRIATDARLVSAPRAERACARKRPGRAVVRPMSIRGSGLFRAIGGASVGTARNAIWITMDRCDGTLTQVGRGRVTLRRRGRHRTVNVRAGRAYLVRARLFRVKKGRRDW